ncbi:MAG: transcriptional repressor [Oscillospiraceae bacterium]|nr:transcriptional repressor [Oscillospiraceae bacterium]
MQRNTVQRQIILSTLKQMKAHPTVEEISARIQTDHPTISKTTVYRNLRLMAESKAIAQILIPDDVERYEGNTDNHHHFKCNVCQEIFDLNIDGLHERLTQLGKMVEDSSGFQADYPEIVFRGVCNHCKE